MKSFKLTYSIILAVTVFASLGCGESGGPDPKVEQDRVNKSVEMRGIYNSVNGDYSKLSAEDKAKFEKFAGGAQAAESTWSMMKTGPSGGMGGVSTPPAGSGQ